MLSLKLPPYVPSGIGDCEACTAVMCVVCSYFAFIHVIPIARIKLPLVFRDTALYIKLIDRTLLTAN